MNRMALYLFLGSLYLIYCTNKNQASPLNTSKLDSIGNIENTQEILKILYDTDQEERSRESIDWSQMARNDKKRLRKAKELLKDSSQFSALDYSRAAMIFQHGGSSEEYKIAVELMEQAIRLDSSINQWLYFAATDRYLMSIEKLQLFGTQYTNSDTGKVILAIDTTKMADSIRSSYAEFPTRIKENLIKLKLLN